MVADEVLKLLDNGWRVLLYKNQLGSISALAVPKGKSVNAAYRELLRYESPDDTPIEQLGFDGPNRYVTDGFAVAEVLHNLTEKVLFGRLPASDDEDTKSS